VLVTIQNTLETG